MEGNRSVEIPASLFRKIEARVRDAGFSSVAEYVTYVLREVVSEDEEPPQEVFSKEDEEKVKERLRSLGYL